MKTITIYLPKTFMLYLLHEPGVSTQIYREARDRWAFECKISKNSRVSPEKKLFLFFFLFCLFYRECSSKKKNGLVVLFSRMDRKKPCTRYTSTSAPLWRVLMTVAAGPT